MRTLMAAVLAAGLATPAQAADNPCGAELYAVTRTKSTWALARIDQTTGEQTKVSDEVRFEAYGLPEEFRISPDGKSAYVRTMRLGRMGFQLPLIRFDLATGKAQRAMFFAKPWVISADGSKVYGGSSSSIRVFDSATGKTTILGSIMDPYSGMAISPDGTRLYVTNRRLGFLGTRDTSTGNGVATAHLGNHPDSVIASPDGKHVYVGTSRNRQLLEFSVDNLRKPARTLDMSVGGSSQDLRPVGITPDSSRLYVYTKQWNESTDSMHPGTFGGPAELKAVDTANFSGSETAAQGNFYNATMSPNGTCVFSKHGTLVTLADNSTAQVPLTGRETLFAYGPEEAR